MHYACSSAAMYYLVLLLQAIREAQSQGWRGVTFLAVQDYEKAPVKSLRGVSKSKKNTFVNKQ